jgi:alkylhydroperoxidase family enzyme
MCAFIWMLWAAVSENKLLAAARNPRDGNSMLAIIRVVNWRCCEDGVDFLEVARVRRCQLSPTEVAAVGPTLAFLSSEPHPHPVVAPPYVTLS